MNETESHVRYKMSTLSVPFTPTTVQLCNATVKTLCLSSQLHYSNNAPCGLKKRIKKKKVFVVRDVLWIGLVFLSFKIFQVFPLMAKQSTVYNIRNNYYTNNLILLHLLKASQTVMIYFHFFHHLGKIYMDLTVFSCVVFLVDF